VQNLVGVIGNGALHDGNDDEVGVLSSLLINTLFKSKPKPSFATTNAQGEITHRLWVVMIVVIYPGP